jgi:hypothetical protein
MYPGVVSRATPTRKPNFPIVSEKRTPYVQPLNESYWVISSPVGFEEIGAVWKFTVPPTASVTVFGMLPGPLLTSTPLSRIELMKVVLKPKAPLPIVLTGWPSMRICDSYGCAPRIEIDEFAPGSFEPPPTRRTSRPGNWSSRLTT